ncbi:MAG TPA: N-acyl homoserine lactonase family protein [Gaiellaceae bacterium]|nr:N-acyl homoserine lactonase family protein [Gaiellaceae bacterium]
MSEPFEVVAIRYGTLRGRKSELVYRYESYGDPDVEVEMAYYFWLLRRPGETVLVDTGFDPAVGARRGRTCVWSPTEALGALGVEPSEVGTVLVTHFHYDHIGNLDAFPRAQIVIPRKELDFWRGPIATRTQFAAHVEPAEIARVERAVDDGRVRLTEGEEEVLEGVTALSVGGHSPGQQVTTVAVADGLVALASDAVHFYEELELDRPFGVIADLAQMYEAYDVLKEMAASGATVVPGHDPDVLRRHPAVDDSKGNAVRLG